MPVIATDIQVCGKYIYTLYKFMGVCLQILQLNFRGLERRLVAACYRYVSDNDKLDSPYTQRLKNTLKLEDFSNY